MGGFGGMMRRGKPFQMSFSMGSAKASLNQGSASQSNPYGRNQFPAQNAFKGGSKFTHTNAGVGEWWKCSFNGGNQWVWKVRVLNRRDCCGGRLKGTKISIGGQECGTINDNTRNGQWYEVKCAKPVRGDKIILETTRRDYLSISGIEVYSAKCTGNGCGGRTTMMRSTSMTRSMRMPRTMKMGGFKVGGMTTSTSTSR